MKIKICGITRLEDALLTEKLGGYAIGFIFDDQSPRYLRPKEAKKISAKLTSIKKIGVFVNETITTVSQIVKDCNLDYVQLHGDESPDYCKELDYPIIKAIPVKNESDIINLQYYTDIVSAILLDTKSSKARGGTGERFDWEIATKAKKYKKKLFLAGGLNEKNIMKAKEIVDPYVYDISSGVEEQPGKKNHKKLKQLFLVIKQILKQ